MRRIARFALLTSLAFGPWPAVATIFVYGSNLSGAQEFPVVNTPGTGSTRVTYDDALHTLRVEVVFSGLVGTTQAAHIHVRPDLATPNGAVATQLPSFSGFPLGVQAGSFDSTFNLSEASSWSSAFITANGGTPLGAEGALFLALQGGRSYLNVHSATSPAGEIRGNLNAVPEPATWAMMILGFALVGGGLRGRLRGSVRFRSA